MYEENQKEYRASSVNSEEDESGNCNNFSTTLLYNASNYDAGVVSTVSNFDPRGTNPGLGEAFGGGNYRISRPQNICSE